MCSLGIHQENQGSNNSPERDGHDHHLLGRYADHGRVGDTADGPHPYLLENLELVINFPKSLLEPRIFWVSGGLQRHGVEAPWGQIKTHSGGSQEASNLRTHHSTGAVKNTGENECQSRQ